MNNNAKRDRHFFDLPNVPGEGWNGTLLSFCANDSEKEPLSVDQLIDHCVNPTFSTHGRMYMTYDKSKIATVKLHPKFDLNISGWYKIYFSIRPEKLNGATERSLTIPRLIYIGLSQGEQNTILNRIHMFFRGITKNNYENENHSAATKFLMEVMYPLNLSTYDKDVIDFFVEVCPLPPQHQLGKVTPEQIESALILRAIREDNQFLMNRKI